jgi:hypothetical protein
VKKEIKNVLSDLLLFRITALSTLETGCRIPQEYIVLLGSEIINCSGTGTGYQVPNEVQLTDQNNTTYNNR